MARIFQPGLVLGTTLHLKSLLLLIAKEEKSQIIFQMVPDRHKPYISTHLNAHSVPVILIYIQLDKGVNLNTGDPLLNSTKNLKVRGICYSLDLTL